MKIIQLLLFENRPHIQPMFDSVAKFLLEQYPADFATWLIGAPVPLTVLQPTELSLEPIRADAIILMQSDDLVLHVEFQTDPKPNIPFRMADYRLRIHRKLPNKRVIQIVIYLRPTDSNLVHQNVFDAGRLHHEFEVIRIWEIPAENFLRSPGLFPYAVLGQTDDREGILQQVALLIDELPAAQQSDLAAVTSILAGLKLEKEIIQRLLRSEIMQESVIYQEIIQVGVDQGRREEAYSLTMRLLTKRFGPLPVDLQTRLTALSVNQIESLSEAILEFHQIDDCICWLRQFN